VYPDRASPWVLVVEDDQTLRDRVLRWLRAAGVQAHAVGNGVEALLSLLDRRSRPCMLVVDADTPHLDGFSLLKLMALQPDLGAIPFLMISSGGADYRERARQLGAVACLHAPLDRSELLAKLAPHIPTLESALPAA
jgi:CheY-like chemotaxis protein